MAMVLLHLIHDGQHHGVGASVIHLAHLRLWNRNLWGRHWAYPPRHLCPVTTLWPRHQAAVLEMTFMRWNFSYSNYQVLFLMINTMLGIGASLHISKHAYGGALRSGHREKAIVIIIFFLQNFQSVPPLKRMLKAVGKYCTVILSLGFI